MAEEVITAGSLLKSRDKKIVTAGSLLKKKDFPEGTILTPNASSIPSDVSVGPSDSGVPEGTTELPNRSVATETMEPATLPKETSYVQGFAKSFNKSLSDIFRTAGSAVRKAEKTIGVPLFSTAQIEPIRAALETTGIGGNPFDIAATLIEKKNEGLLDAPDDIAGNVLSGVGGIVPDIISATLMPEVKVGGWLAKVGVKGVDKFAMYLGAKEGTKAMEQSEGGTSTEQILAPLEGAAQGFTTGLLYNAFGVVAGVIGKGVAGKLVKNPESFAGTLTQATGATASNALMFGGYAGLEELAQTGKITSKNVATNIGIGLALGAKDIGKLSFVKGMQSFIATPTEQINKVYQSKATPEQMKAVSDEGLNEINSKLENTKQPEPINQAELDNNIRAAQLRLGLPAEVETPISDNTIATLSKLRAGEAVTNDMLQQASDELYGMYKGLEGVKSSSTRKFTTDQITKKSEALGSLIETLENTIRVQTENEQFLSGQDQAVVQAVVNDNLATLKAFTEQVIKDPQQVKQAVEESTLPDEAKKELTDKINQVVSDNDPKNIQAKPITEEIDKLNDQKQTVESGADHPAIKKKKVQIIDEKLKLADEKLDEIFNPQPEKPKEEPEPEKPAEPVEPEPVQPSPTEAAKPSENVEPLKPKSNENVEKTGREEVLTPTEPVTPAKAKATKAPKEKTSKNFVDKKISEINVDEDRFQNRSELDEDQLKKIVENWNENELDPVVLWRDKDGKEYLLAGHHRLEGAKRKGKKTIVSRYFSGTEQEAIEYAKVKSNANRTLEQPFDRAKIYRKMREDDKPRKEIKTALEQEGKNKVYIENLSYLNPKGKLIDMLRSFAKAGDKQTIRITEQAADWIGEARKNFPEFTDMHENELYDWLINKGNIDKINTKEELLDRLQRVADFIRLNPDEPLNLDYRRTYGSNESDKLAEINAVKRSIKDLEKERDDNKKPATAQRLNEISKEIQEGNNRLAKLREELIVAKESDKSQFDIFSQINEEVNNGTVTRESVRRIEDRPAGEDEKLEPTVKDIESKAESDRKAELDQAVQGADEIIKPKPAPPTVQSLQEDLAAKRITLKEYQEKIEEVRKATKPSDTAKKLADKVRSLKQSGNLDEPSTMGFSDRKLWNDILDFIADGIESGGKVADMIQRGIDYLKSTDFYKNLSNSDRAKHVDMVAGAFKSFEEADNIKERKFFRTIQTAENISEETKAKLGEDPDNRFYVIRSNNISKEQAKAYVDEFGLDQTIKDLTNPEVKMQSDSRNFLSMEAMRQADDLGKQSLESGDNVTAAGHFEDANTIAESMVKEATILGRAVQSYKTLGSPERIVYNIRKAVKQKRDELKKGSQDKIDRKKTDIKDKIRESVDETLDQDDVQDKIKKARRKKTDPAETLAKRIIARLNPSDGKKFDPVKEIVNVLFKKVDETMPKKPAVKESQMSKLKRVLSDKQQYAEVWEKAKGEVQRIMQEKGFPDEVIDEYNSQLEAFYNEVIGRPYNETLIEGVTREGMSQANVDLNDVIRKHYTVYDATKRSLVDKLIEDAGVDGEDARLLAESVGRAFDKAARKRIETTITRMLAPKSKGKAKKSSAEELIELLNMGAFSDSQFVDWYAKKEGWPALSPENISELYKLAEKVQNTPDGFQKFNATEDLMKYREKLRGISWGEIGQAFWYSNVLSGLPTHMVNFIANTANTFQLLSNAAMKNPKQTPEMIYGLVKGLQKGWYDAGDVMRTGYSPVRAGKLEVPNVLEVVNFKGGKWNPANYAKFVRRLMVASDMIHYSANKNMREYQLARRQAKNDGVKNVTLADIQDKLFNTRERIEQAERQATSEGLTGRDYKRRVFELVEQSRPVEMIEDGANFGSRATFNYPSEGSLGILTDGVNAITSAVNIAGVRPLKFIIPFTNIISNVANNAIDYTPYGLVRAAKGGVGWRGFDKVLGPISKNKWREFTPEQRTDELVKAATGIITMAALYALTEPDDKGKSPVEITANGTGNFKKNYELRELGWRPYSIRIGDRWISYQYTPLSLAFAPIGFLRDREKYNGETVESIGIQNIINSTVYQTWRFMADMTFVGTLSNFMEAVGSDNPKSGIKLLEKTMNTTLKSMVIPNFYNHLAKFYNEQFDIPTKETDGLLQQLMKDIPIVRNSMNDKLNALGEPVVLQTDRIETSVRKNPVWEFIVRNKAFIGVPKKEDIIIEYPQPREPSPDEYYDFVKMRGEIIKDKIKILMENEASLTQEEIQKQVDNIKRDATTQAKMEVFSISPTRTRRRPSRSR